jgi:hypothetical protein
MLRWIGIIWFAATGIFAGAVCLLQLFVRTIDWSTRPQDAMDFPSRLRAAWLVVEPMLTTNALLSLILATSLTALSLLTFGPGLWRRFCSSRFGEIVGLASTRHPLVLVPPQPHINHSEALTNVKTGENVYHETYFIAVVNRSEDHETIKNLQLHVGF